jgi:hypothetical protein
LISADCGSATGTYAVGQHFKLLCNHASHEGDSRRGRFDGERWSDLSHRCYRGVGLGAWAFHRIIVPQSSQARLLQGGRPLIEDGSISERHSASRHSLGYVSLAGTRHSSMSVGRYGSVGYPIEPTCEVSLSAIRSVAESLRRQFRRVFPARGRFVPSRGVLRITVYD